MEIFLVGGAVRDDLLGRPVQDRDWVVVGARPEDMKAQGFAQVGADFPVFLHPVSHEEYALARTERKTGKGYHGFAVSADPTVTLEEDLSRRDLTINAMARATDGTLVDPFHGAEDLKARVLRHVSPAFAEDPVRVLRVARFAARYAEEGFTVAPETMTLMRQMVEAGEVDTLVAERVWAEFVKASKTSRPSVFLRVLHDCGALARVLPEVDALYGVPQVATHHPEIDTGIHTEMVLDMAARLAPGRSDVAFAALTHDLGKALTPKDELPKHLNHEATGLKPLAAVVARWKVPSEVSALARAVCKHHLIPHQGFEVRVGTLLDLFEAVDAFRTPQRLEAFLLACEADKRGRLGRTEVPYAQGDHLRAVFAAAQPIKAQPFVEAGKVGKEVGFALREARLRAMHAIHGPVRKAHAAAQRAKAQAAQIAIPENPAVPTPASRPKM